VEEVKILYRYDNPSYAYNGRIVLTEYEVVKETPCGYWFRRKGDFQSFDFPGNGSRKKWTSKTALRRQAYPTTDAALYSFTKRKEKQIMILKHQLHRAEKGLHEAQWLVKDEL